MSTSVHEELLRFVLTKTEDPEVKARQQLVARVYVETVPGMKAAVEAEIKAAAEAKLRTVEAEIRATLEAKGRLAEARSALRRVLSGREIALSAEDKARIDACADLATLERWHDQAIHATSAAAAFREPDVS